MTMQKTIVITSEFIAATINSVRMFHLITFNGNVLVSNRKLYAVIVYIYDGGAITGNGLLGDVLGLIVLFVTYL